MCAFCWRPSRGKWKWKGHSFFYKFQFVGLNVQPAVTPTGWRKIVSKEAPLVLILLVCINAGKLMVFFRRKPTGFLPQKWGKSFTWPLQLPEGSSSNPYTSSDAANEYYFLEETEGIKSPWPVSEDWMWFNFYSNPMQGHVLCSRWIHLEMSEQTLRLQLGGCWQHWSESLQHYRRKYLW